MFKKLILISSCLWALSCSTNNKLESISSNTSKYKEKCIQLFNSNNYSEAIPFCEKAANKGDVLSQNILSNIYVIGGYGVSHDYQKAVYWLQKAADQKDLLAINNLASMYEEGRGVIKNLQKAIKMYEESCNKGYNGACNNLKRLNH